MKMEFLLITLLQTLCFSLSLFSTSLAARDSVESSQFNEWVKGSKSRRERFHSSARGSSAAAATTTTTWPVGGVCSCCSLLVSQLESKRLSKKMSVMYLFSWTKFLKFQPTRPLNRTCEEKAFFPHPPKLLVRVTTAILTAALSPMTGSKICVKHSMDTYSKKC